MSHRVKGYHQQITREEFYALGGFANPKTFRKMISGIWRYYWKA
jgi:hypothetical protein